MLDCMGYRTGMDLAGVLDAAEVLRGLVGHDLQAQVFRAGPRLKLHPVPADYEQIRARALERDNAPQRSAA